MKTPFSVGDRVRVYTGDFNADWRVRTATIQSIREDNGLLCVEWKPKNTFYAHPKQCRRLIKKPRRRVWLHENAVKENRVDSEGWIVSLERPTYSPGPFIEFVEVRKATK